MVGGSWARTGLPPAVASASYDANNRQLAFGSQTLGYDLNGNLSTDGVKAYSWDARNRLVGVAGPVVASFVYDSAGRRQAATIDGMTTSVVHDFLNPVQEQTASATVNVLTGLGIDEFYARADAGGAQRYFADGLGSTVALTDGGGTVQAEYTYDAFGATVVIGTTGNRYDFTGRENDATGLKYYRARYYNPVSYRFLSEDPLGLMAGDANLYAYVSNDPVNLFDATGELSPFALAVLGAGLGATTGAIRAGFSGCGFGGIVAGAAQGGIVGAVSGFSFGTGLPLINAAARVAFAASDVSLIAQAATGVWGLLSGRKPKNTFHVLMDAAEAGVVAGATALGAGAIGRLFTDVAEDISTGLAAGLGRTVSSSFSVQSATIQGAGRFAGGGCR